MDLSVVIPTRNEESTVAGVVAHCLDAGADEVLVVDSGSTDATRDAARAAGAAVHDSSDLFAELGAVRGKGDALWRALPLTSGELVAFVDGDLTVFDDLLPRLLAPLDDDGVRFSKANITRLDGDGHRRYGRVTQYTAKPLLAVLFPELADLDEPLSGQVAAERDVLMRLGFEPDYGLEVGMLIDVWRTFGRDAIAHPDCGRIIHAEQSDDDLGDMAAVVARAALARSGHDAADHVVRPPHLG